MAWQETLLRRLREGLNYRSRGAAEPTALAAVAFAARGQLEDAAAPRQWLAGQQRPDGGVPVLDQLEGPCWPTALAALAWESDDAYQANADRAREWLRQTHGLAFEHDEMVGHDPTLVGWSWTDETHSWVEPTSHALLALRADEPRERTGEAVRLLLDRCVPDGGWNYGNTRVLDNMLRPFPATTGVALAALAGHPEVTPEGMAAVQRSQDWLVSALEDARAPLSLGWGLIGLGRWGRYPASTNDWLTASVEADIEADPLHDALRLLAMVPGVLSSPMREAAPIPDGDDGTGRPVNRRPW
ncbi:MAG: hypothetical protein JRH11_20055 [Deltaproteobacteria bacterium]|nr:hypothetical protein [Deltaproteobacteria bacterium]